MLKSKESIRISTDTMMDICRQINSVEAKLRDRQNAVERILDQLNQSSGIDVKVSMNLRLNAGGSFYGRDIGDALAQCRKALNSCAQESRRISSAVTRAAGCFEDTENKVTAAFAAMNTGGLSAYAQSVSLFDKPVPVLAQASANIADHKGTDGVDWQWGQLIQSVVGSFGIVGGAVDALWDIAQGDMTGLAKFAVKATQVGTEWNQMVKAFNKTKNFGIGFAKETASKKLVGLQKYAYKEKFTFSKAAKWATRVKTNFGKAFKSGMKNTLSWGLELVDRGIDNYKEVAEGYKSKGTAIAEWATEAVVGVTVAALCGAAATALLPATATVAVVGVVGGVIAWGVDTIWSNTVGKGKDEDGGNEGIAESIGEGIVEFGSNVFNGIKGLFTNDKNVSAAWS